ncbi:MAG: hypothetical protein AAFV62_02295 [Pseudomonadota bacterium]
MSFLDQLVGGEDRRAPQPLDRYDIHDRVRPQLFDLTLDAERPVFAVDVDEVVVDFANHLGEFVADRGLEMSLTEYKIDGAITRIADGQPLNRAEVGAEIDAFFRAEAENQRAVPGAVEALQAIAEHHQVVFVTNVPFHARDARISNLLGHGLDFPLIANSGGKGWVLRYLWDHSSGPMAYVDDAHLQLLSCEKRAPAVSRIHYVADQRLRQLSGRSEAATHRSECWTETRSILEQMVS